MDILIKKAFIQLLFWLYEFLDAVFEMFQVLCGITPVEYTENGDTVSRSIIEIFLQSSAVIKAFLLLFLIAIIVCAFSIIAAVVKNTINMKGGERKSHAKTVGQGFGSIIVTVVMAVIMVLGISGSNAVLGKVYTATIADDSLSISAMLFNMSVSESYAYDYSNPLTRKEQATDENGNLLWEKDDGEATTNKDDAKRDINNLPVRKTILITYYDYLTVKDENGNDKLDENGNKIYVLISGWQDDYSAADIVFGKTTVNQVFGVHRKNAFGIEDSDRSYTKQPMVTLDSFNIYTAYFVVILVIISLVWSMLGLVKRIFDLVTLFIMLPLISATIPLDDGARLKTWRETVVSKVILAYGAVISVNVFLLMVPLITNINFASLGWSKFLENLFKMFMLIGGALCINGGQLLIARIFGTSAEESKEMAQSARALLGGTVAAGGMLHSAKNALFGGRNKYGRETKGIFRGAKKLAGTATNVAGNVLGGQAYRSTASKAMGVVGKVKDAISGVATYRRPSTSSALSNLPESNYNTKDNNLPSQQVGQTGQVGKDSGNAVGTVANKPERIFKNGAVGAVIGRIKLAKEQSKFQRGSRVIKGIKPSNAYKPPKK